MAGNFFDYQRRMLGILLAWGAGNTAASVPMVLSRDARVQQFGLQALAWGAIDAGLALVGRRNAYQQAQRYERGDIDGMAVTHEAHKLRRILLINAGLDVGYILGGAWVARAFPNRPGRQGIGQGILVQGLFLLIYDGLFAWDLSRRWLSRTRS